MKAIHPSAAIGKDVKIGNYTTIMDDVQIGDSCIIGNNVVIHSGTVIGRGVRIDDGAVIGKLPMRSVRSALKASGDLPPAVVGDECLIGTHTVIYRGSVIGDKVMVADLATVRENTVVESETIIGRGAAIENYCKVGCRCKIETNAYITAYSNLYDDVFIAPGVVTTNDNFVGRGKERFKYFKGITAMRGARIGAQATILPGKVVEEEALVAAGSVLTCDAQSKKVYIGSPAKVKKEVPPEQLLENQ